MGIYMVAGVFFLIGFFSGMFVFSRILKSKYGEVTNGYDRQAYNSDANLALNYIETEDYEKAEDMLRRIIKRTGMGFRDEDKK